MSVALYIRLSLADEETGFSKTESDSIVNQRMCLHNFLDNDKVLVKLHRSEFVDDGYTATNGNRPSFTKMLELVQAGEIKTIIVRDFSRFFRDYIEAGNYLECVFPFLGVRFISINDNYDSDDYKGSTGGLEMVMRNIIYASYSKDLSVKTTTAKIHMMKQGKYVGGYAPYGYKMHETIKHKLSIDTESAKVVRFIFDSFLEGKSKSEITIELNKNNVPTMSQYFKMNNPSTKKFSGVSDKSKWTTVALNKILKNRLFTGAMVSHKQKSAGLGSRKVIQNTPIIVEDMHEAIVTKEEFEKVQKLLEHNTKRTKYQQNEYPLKSLLKCGHCKRAMVRGKVNSDKNFFRCPSKRLYDNTTCTGSKINEREIEKITYNAISDCVVALQDKFSIKADKKIKTLDVVAELSVLDSQIESLKNYKIRLYENYTTGDITKDLFLKQKADADKKIADIETEKVALKEKIQAKRTDTTTPNLKIDNLITIFSKEDKLTYEMARAFIKAIYIYDEADIEIEWKFKDIFTEV